MIYILTAVEIVSLKNLIEQLAALADLSEYTEEEVEEAIDLINTLKPTNTEDFLAFTESLEKSEELPNL